jgi:hypothetical protein
MPKYLGSLALFVGTCWIVLLLTYRFATQQFGNIFPQLSGGQSIDALRELIRLLPLLIFWVTMSILWGINLLNQQTSMSQKTPTVLPTSGSAGRLVAWVLGAVFTISLVAGTIIRADPNGLYGTKLYQPLYLCTRDEKAMSYLALSESPEVVILGASRAFSMSPRYIRETLGYSAFNASTGGASPEDMVIMARFMFEHANRNPPRVLLVEVEPGIFVFSDFTAFCTPLYMLPYMTESTARMAIQDRVSGLLDPKQLADSIYSIRYHQLYGPPDTYWKFDPLDGHGVARNTQDLTAELTADIALNKPLHTTNLPCNKSEPCAIDKVGENFLEELVKLAREQNTAVVFYQTPIHPLYFDAFYKDNHQWQARSAALVDFMQDLRQRYDNVYYLNYSRLDSFHGLDTEAGYYDGVHMTAENNNRIINAAAGTLRQAYQWAEIKRHSNTTGE